MSPCPICGATQSRAIEGVSDYVTGELFRVVQCARCSFGRTEPVPPSLDRYYPARYRSFNPLAARFLRWSYRRRVDGWLARLPRSGRALEIGTGGGWMLRALRERGWEAIGTERTVDAARAASEASGAPVYAADLDTLTDERPFDLVVMFHVLEHLEDPVATLRSAASRLRPGGTLVLGLPNSASWQSRVMGRHWMHLDVPRHLGHFSPEAIRQALATTGFDLVNIDFRSYEHDPLGWTQSALDALGFEQGVILKRLIGLRERRGSIVSTVIAFVLAVPLTVAGFVLAPLSWQAHAGAVMQVWAVRRT
jgi:2-polyprenyl-3-methyl-5-hydroxy-6-metoxy-1,4-benzoquinol methylase